jgi:DMSO/TMAO reductase YedYZ molybdopterin-dependent catalytic subunit
MKPATVGSFRRYPSAPWLGRAFPPRVDRCAARPLLARAGLRSDAKDIVFRGADRGFDRDVEHEFARSLEPELARREEVLLAYAMNGEALPPQHGAPLRLIVPRWYGMASVKWLYAIEAIDRKFDGLQQASGYHWRRATGEKGASCTRMRVNSLMVPPGIPDFFTRKRTAAAGTVEIAGRAWSGAGQIDRVELAVNGVWRDAVVEGRQFEHAWQAWRAAWEERPGEHELACRATDSTGERQPLEPPWDASGIRKQRRATNPGHGEAPSAAVNALSSCALFGSDPNGSLYQPRRIHAEQTACCAVRVRLRAGRLRAGSQGRAQDRNQGRSEKDTEAKASPPRRGRARSPAAPRPAVPRAKPRRTPSNPRERLAQPPGFFCGKVAR